MVALILDRSLEKRLIAKRRAWGIDQHDEVWNGVYYIFAPKDDEHQALITEIGSIFEMLFGWTGLAHVYPGINVSDRQQDWMRNYRSPDVALYFKTTSAIRCGTHWCGGPDFGIEIVSPGDRALKKLPFYEKVGTRELLVIDRKPWALTLYRRREGSLVEAGSATVENSQPIPSEVLPLTWRLVVEEGKPAIEIAHADGVQRWLVPSSSE